MPRKVNVNAKPLVDEWRTKRNADAKSFAFDCRQVQRPKDKVVVDMKNNYGLTTSEARTLYKASKPCRRRH